MTFWTWAKVLYFSLTLPTMLSFPPQGLEDQFDCKSRRRLDGFIVPEDAGSKPGESNEHNESEIVQLSALDANTNLYYVNPPLPGSAGEAEHNALSRLPIFAIFHGISHERGVPPSFTGSSALSFLLSFTANRQNYFDVFRFHPAVASSSPFWRLPYGVRRTRGPRPRWRSLRSWSR